MFYAIINLIRLTKINQENECDGMKKIVKWLAAISIIVFVIAWGIGGLKIYDAEYENNAWLYVGIVSIMIFFCSLIYLKTTRCPHCSKMNLTFGKYCTYCGKKIK